jgi:hypothetical protein
LRCHSTSTTAAGSWGRISRQEGPRPQFTRIDPPGAIFTRALGIDGHGRIVGDYQDATGTTHGYLRDSGGRFTTIDIPGAIATTVWDINDQGQMVGEYADVNGFHGFLMDDGVVSTIDAPGATATTTVDINNRGQIIGLSFDATGQGAFLLSKGRFSTIAAPGTLAIFLPLDIDDRGRIVGTIG